MPIAGTTSPASLGLRDAGNERGVFRIDAAVLTTDNIVEQTASWDALVVLAMALVLGAKVYSQYGNKTEFITTQPTNGAAREFALLIQGQDTETGQRVTAKLPTLALTAIHYAININARDVVLLTEPTPVVNFITALNGLWLNPVTGNAVTVVGLKATRGGK